MADSALPARSAPSRRRVDGLSLAAAVLFVLAVAAAAYPALQAGPQTGPGLLLLVGLGGTAVLGVLAFALSDRAPAEAAVDAPADVEGLIDALPEPAAVLAEDGRIACANGAWRGVWGDAGRLPKGSGAQTLYPALVAARRGEAVSGAPVSTPKGTRAADVAPLAADRFLVRLSAPPSFGALAAGPAPAAEEPAPVRPSGPAPVALDAFAAGAPFGAALLDGADPFTAPILQANPALLAMSGGRAQPGAVFGDLFDAATAADARARLLARPDAPAEVRLALTPPRTAQLFVASAGDRSVAYLLDVSEQKQLELQLAQSQKMQAIGQLAGGVAHDFNNLLTAIQFRLDELLHRHPVGDPSYEGLNEIRQTGVRAADLVRKLLAFSRKQTVQREVLELGALMSECEVLLRRLLREDVRLVTDYGRDTPLVKADKAQLETAVMNLAVNARDALRSDGAREGQPGEVRIKTARCTQAEAQALGYPEAGPAGAALIEVADNGKGIPPQVIDKIFEPFFTTKPVGEGTGLGLATVYGIVKQADGWIHVESPPGQGATFRIFLPIHQPAAGETLVAPPVAATPAKPKPARDLSGVGRILFVEDEDAVRIVAARLLRARGYEVIEAADGEEALALCEQHAGEIDLLISDVIMPGLDGPTLLKKARGFLGDAQVLFISGYAEAEFSDLLEGEEGVTFLPKPIDIKVLAERVKQQLQAA
jgi:two-component system cell cycle sensor histidine kinase/response regulator CckA